MLTYKRIIIILGSMALILSLVNFFLNRPPRVVEYQPNQNTAYFAQVEVKFNRDIPLEAVELIATPPLGRLIKSKPAPKQVVWSFDELPESGVKYSFRVSFRKKPIFDWQIITPSQPLGIGSYPTDFNQQVKDYLESTKLLQSLPPPNNYFKVRYIDETNIIILLIHPDKTEAEKQAKKWLKQLDPDIKRRLSIEWVR